jgi:hypothetical protein
MRVYGKHHLAWRGDRLMVRIGGRAAPSVELVPDGCGMWRVRCADGSLTDRLNRARAREAAWTTLLAGLNAGRTPAGSLTGALNRGEPTRGSPARANRASEAEHRFLPVGVSA